MADVTVGLYVRLEARRTRPRKLPSSSRARSRWPRTNRIRRPGSPSKMGPSTFGIFDVFPSDDGRQAHLNGPIAAALMEQAPTSCSQSHRRSTRSTCSPRSCPAEHDGQPPSPGRGCTTRSTDAPSWLVTRSLPPPRSARTIVIGMAVASPFSSKRKLPRMPPAHARAQQLLRHRGARPVRGGRSRRA